MELASAFIVMPVAIFVGLASLPRGRPAAAGCLVAVVVAAGIWATQMGRGAKMLFALALMSDSAIALASIVQVVRVAFGPDRHGWMYPGIVFWPCLVRACR